MNRWRVVAGGVSMNLALGSLYAWSVFVLPLEKEFGWTRAQTSWVFTIAVLMFAATFILAGRIQDARGPRLCALLGISAGLPASRSTARQQLPYRRLALATAESRSSPGPKCPGHPASQPWAASSSSSSAVALPSCSSTNFR